MSHDDNHDAGEDLLAGIDLTAWKVPPPSSVHRPSLLGRALTPATAPARRPKLAWIVAAILITNALVAALIVIVIGRQPTERTVIIQAPAGGPSDQQRVRDILRQMDDSVAKIHEMQALITELSGKLDQCEQKEHTVPRPRPPTPPSQIGPIPLDPYAAPTTGLGCDEVGCVLGNYADACCAKFKKPQPPDPTKNLPETIDRTAISNTISVLKPRIMACGENNPAKGKVKVHVVIASSGSVTNVIVEVAPDAELGRCVASVLQRGAFPRTQAGGSFTYPFIF